MEFYFGKQSKEITEEQRRMLECAGITDGIYSNGTYQRRIRKADIPPELEHIRRYMLRVAQVHIEDRIVIKGLAEEKGLVAKIFRM